jgi:hypothetical protein
VFARTAFGVDVMSKFTFCMDKIATPWTVGVLVKCGKRDFVGWLVPGYFHDDALSNGY